MNAMPTIVILSAAKDLAGLAKRARFFAALRMTWAAIALCLLTTTATADPSGTDDELLKDLGQQSVDRHDQRLRGEETKKDAAPAADTKAKVKDNAALQKELERTLGEAGRSEDANPLLRIAQRMQEMQATLARRNGGPATQDAQREIVAELDELMKQAQKNCSSCNSGSCDKQSSAQCNKPGGNQCAKPGTRPGSQPGKRPPGERNAPITRHMETHRPDMVEMRALVKQLWGELPERDRQQMLDLPMDEFLPQYEQQIEEYFRRLSDTKPETAAPR
jgi:hypothetical protein